MNESSKMYNTAWGHLDHRLCGDTKKRYTTSSHLLAPVLQVQVVKYDQGFPPRQAFKLVSSKSQQPLGFFFAISPLIHQHFFLMCSLFGSYEKINRSCSFFQIRPIIIFIQVSRVSPQLLFFPHTNLPKINTNMFNFPSEIWIFTIYLVVTFQGHHIFPVMWWLKQTGLDLWYD